MQKQKYVCAVLSDLLCDWKLKVLVVKLTQQSFKPPQMAILSRDGGAAAAASAAVYCRAAKFLPYITRCHIMTNSKLTEGL